MLIRADAATARLRQTLTHIATQDPTVHSRLVAPLSRRVQHSIQLAEELPSSRSLYQRYNCHQYAVGLVGVDQVIHASQVRRDVFVGREFVQRLIENLEEISYPDGHDGIVVYYQAGTIEHSGRWLGGRVRSKWGAHGHVWEHAAHEVPADYGNAVQFFDRPSPEIALAQFLEYARQRGVQV